MIEVDSIFLVSVLFVIGMVFAIIWRSVGDSRSRLGLLGLVGTLITATVNWAGYQLVSSPLLQWDSLVGIFAAMYTVASRWGIPEEVVTFVAAVLGSFFILKLLYKSASLVTEGTDRI